MVDFTQLRGSDDGRRGSFERLVRHLAEINPPADAIEFRPIEGAGGDGGIEAYWVLADGSEMGYQAKFHRRAGEIDWSALTNSVVTALSTHPALTRMIVAMPCDLTDVTRGRGKSAREKWNGYCARWQESAGDRSIGFELLGASQIERLLAAPAAQGLREYWFGETELSGPWFEHAFARTVAALDERYHPEDHVDVQANQLFKAIRGSAGWRSELKRLALAAAAAMPPPTDPASKIAPGYRALAAVLDKLADMATESAIPPERPFATKAWIATIEEAVRASRSIQNFFGEDEGRQSYAIRRAREDITEVENLLTLLSSRLRSEYQRADASRYAIIEGAAGSGKSHLIAAAVAEAIAAGEPALMLLGTDFSGDEEPGAQIARRLGLAGLSTPTFLGALEAAAAARGCRALIAIDALNESGARYWRERLASFAADVRSFPRLVLCVSCRDVYARRVFTQAARAEAAQIEIVGFETEEEREAAARVYLDRRGIARPAAPWLPPEFANPLFLRTTCVALARRGERAFPLGLRGTRAMMRFYLAATAATLGTVHDGTDELEGPLVRGVLAIAGEMAGARRDYIGRGAAARLLAEAFAGYAKPAEHTWLELLRLAGLLRVDPPMHDLEMEDDPLAAREDILRFAFQRFQDHLVARNLIAGHPAPTGLFDGGGPLAFILERWNVAYDWTGVFAALALEFADEWQVEIVDHLPGGHSRWSQDPTVEDAFIESVRWRRHSSFTARTLELLQALEWPRTPIDLLVELSAVEGHPWNADMLHDSLVGRSLPDRDAYWTQEINGEPDRRGAAHRLADWGLGSGPRSANSETLRLALTTLGWVFASTNWALRDLATKAATEILLRAPEAHADFLARFADVNDIYVPERVVAAMASACLRDPNPERLAAFAASIWRHVFASGNPPLHVLLRDHACLIIELAAESDVLPKECDLARCRPPYWSSAPRFKLNEARVKAECEAVGDHSIFQSTAAWGGDFGTYVIKNRIEAFSAVRLSRPRPVRNNEAFENFKRDCIAGDELRETLMEIIEDLAESELSERRKDTLVNWNIDSEEEEEEEEEMQTTPPVAPDDEWAAIGKHAETALLKSLGARERKRFATDARPYLEGKRDWFGANERDLPLVDETQARLWIARRAVSLGWTRDRFPRDHASGDETTRARRIERIGKKYQWIAYHELIARLADNFWLAAEWDEQPTRAYATPLDLAFTRDLEPTVHPGWGKGASGERGDVPSVPRLTLADVPAEAMYDWVFDDSIPAQRLDFAYCGDLAEPDEWLTLYRYASRRTAYLRENYAGAPSRLDDFHFLLMVGVPASERETFVSQLESAGTDFHDWMTWGSLTDGPYLYEAGIRSTWPDDEWVTSDSFRPPEMRYLRFCRGYHWEHHIDGTLPDGISLQVPSPWLLRSLELVADPYRPGVYCNALGQPTIVSSIGERDTYSLIRRSALEDLLRARNVIPLWVGVGERGAWPNPEENKGPNRRWNGIVWSEDGARGHGIWAQDHRPGGATRTVRRRVAASGA